MAIFFNKPFSETSLLGFIAHIYDIISHSFSFPPCDVFNPLICINWGSLSDKK